MENLGIERRRTTAYHPACNGAIERFHRTLRNSLRAHCNKKTWFNSLPLALLGIPTAVNKHGMSPALLLYGSQLELPTHFFVPTKPDISAPTAEFLEQFFTLVRNFPQPQREHAKLHHVPKSLSETPFVWLLDKAPQSSLSDRYLGPYKVVQRDQKTITIELDGRNEKVSIDRVKPAFLESELVTEESPVHPQAVVAKQAVVPEQKPPKFQIGTVVLAKSRNYPVWPAVIVDPQQTDLRDKRQPRKTTAVHFFGTGNVAFIPDDKIQPYKQLTTKDARVKNAIGAANNYLSRQPTYDQANTIVWHGNTHALGKFSNELPRRAKRKLWKHSRPEQFRCKTGHAKATPLHKLPQTKSQ